LVRPFFLYLSKSILLILQAAQREEELKGKAADWGLGGVAISPK
jgi:hypothetical protein